VFSSIAPGRPETVFVGSPYAVPCERKLLNGEIPLFGRVHSERTKADNSGEEWAGTSHSDVTTV